MKPEIKSDGFRVPWGLAEDQSLVRPTPAGRGRSYRCPSCLDRLVLRAGSKVSAHFAHRASASCSGETVLHKTAKLLLRDAVSRWKAGGPGPVVVRRCRRCGAEVRQVLPDKVDRAEVEQPLPDGFVLDVALFAGEEIVASVEVFVKHPVEGRKLDKLDLPFVELVGEEVCRDPLTWVPRLDRFRPFKCPICSEAWRVFCEKVSEISLETKVPVPPKPFIYAPHHCWSCNREILVFAWPETFEDGLVQYECHSEDRPCEKMPWTIRRRTIRFLGYVNTCPFCKATQGPGFLTEPDCALFGCQSDERDPLRSVALYWFRELNGDHSGDGYRNDT